MASVTSGYTFGATELVTATKLNGMVDDATITDSDYVFYQGDIVSWENSAVTY